MSLNIKNARTHALVRELARRTGVSQTRAVEDAVSKRLAELGPETASADRVAAARAIVAAFRAELSEAELRRIREAERELYDEAGLPR